MQRHPKLHVGSGNPTPSFRQSDFSDSIQFRPTIRRSPPEFRPATAVEKFCQITSEWEFDPDGQAEAAKRIKAQCHEAALRDFANRKRQAKAAAKRAKEHAEQEVVRQAKWRADMRTAEIQEAKREATAARMRRYLLTGERCLSKPRSSPPPSLLCPNCQGQGLTKRLATWWKCEQCAGGGPPSLPAAPLPFEGWPFHENHAFSVLGRTIFPTQGGAPATEWAMDGIARKAFETRESLWSYVDADRMNHSKYTTIKYRIVSVPRGFAIIERAAILSGLKEYFPDADPNTKFATVLPESLTSPSPPSPADASEAHQ